jgi:alkanesulfonate monooxygenase SsuD/methylene tetrahydromethanopterin reductase-like flavin-dependent oxidoreductase (luciferase family)
VPSAKIPVVIGGGAEAAVRRAARLADGIFANVPKNEFLQQIDWIRDECEKVDRDPSELRIIHYSVMLPGKTENDAFDTYGSHLWQMTWKYSDMEASATRSGPPPPAPPFDEARRERVLGRSTIAGPGDQIVTQLNEIREAAGLPVEFVARSYFHTLEYVAQVELMQQLAEEVSPFV